MTRVSGGRPSVAGGSDGAILVANGLLPLFPADVPRSARLRPPSAGCRETRAGK
jgi:hypothetical protein